jgi:CRISPR-associated protein Csx3
MEKLIFTTVEADEYTLVSFEISDALIPEDLSMLSPPSVNGAKGVVLSGRGPIWLYCFLAHFYHPTKFIATHDPRLEGAVIVERHSPEYKVGLVIKC